MTALVVATLMLMLRMLFYFLLCDFFLLKRKVPRHIPDIPTSGTDPLSKNLFSES